LQLSKKIKAEIGGSIVLVHRFAACEAPGFKYFNS
jgi:hypothetical protein